MEYTEKGWLPKAVSSFASDFSDPCGFFPLGLSVSFMVRPCHPPKKS